MVCDLAREDMAEAVEDAFRYGKLVLASVTYNADVFPFMKIFSCNFLARSSAAFFVLPYTDAYAIITPSDSTP